MMVRFGANEDGAFSVMMAVLGAAILMTLGLVVDGGRQLGALSEATDVADNAARVGSQHVDLELLRDTGRPVINTAEASAAVQTFMTFSGYSSRGFTARVVPTPGPDPDLSVTVEVTIQSKGFLFPSRTKTATQTAHAVDSVAGP